MDTPNPEGRTPGRYALAFAGRFLGVLSTTILGTVLGMVAGAYRANSQMNGGPDHGHATMGMESEGLVTLVIWVVNLLLGAAVGLMLGLVVGVVGMVAYRRAKG